MSVSRAHFPPELRLLTAADYQKVFKQAQYKASDKYLLILAIPNSFNFPRLGMAISIKNSGNAVNRNRLKRLIRETFRTRQTDIASQDYIVLTRKGITALSNQQIVNALTQHWQTITKKCVK